MAMLIMQFKQGIQNMLDYLGISTPHNSSDDYENLTAHTETDDYGGLS